MPNDPSNTSPLSAASEDSSSDSKELWVLNAQTRSPDRPSLKYSDGGSGPLWKKNEAFCLPTSGAGGQYIIARNQRDEIRCMDIAPTVAASRSAKQFQYIVSASRKSTNTPSKSTSDISP